MEHFLERLYDPVLYTDAQAEARKTILSDLMAVCRNDIVAGDVEENSNTQADEAGHQTSKISFVEAKQSAFSICATLIDFHSSLDGLQESMDEGEGADAIGGGSQPWWGYKMVKSFEVIDKEGKDASSGKGKESIAAMTGAAHAQAVNNLKSNFFALFADIITIFTQHASVPAELATAKIEAPKPTKKRRAEKAAESETTHQFAPPTRIQVSLLDAASLLAIHDFFNINLIEAGKLQEAVASNITSTPGNTAADNNKSRTDGSQVSSPQDSLLASPFITSAPTKADVDKLVVFRGLVLMARALLLAATLNYGHSLESIGDTVLPLGKNLSHTAAANQKVNTALKSLNNNHHLPTTVKESLAAEEPESVQALFVSVDEVRRLLIDTYRTSTKESNANYLLSLQEQLLVVMTSIDGETNDNSDTSTTTTTDTHEAIVKASPVKKEKLRRAILAKLIHQRLYMDVVRDISTLVLSDLLRVLTFKSIISTHHSNENNGDQDNQTTNDSDEDLRALETIVCPRALLFAEHDQKTTTPLSTWLPISRTIRPIVHFGANPIYLSTIESIEEDPQNNNKIVVAFGLHPVALYVVDSLSRNLHDSFGLFNDVAVEASKDTPSAIFNAMIVASEKQELAKQNQEEDNENNNNLSDETDVASTGEMLSISSLYNIFAFSTTPLSSSVPALVTLQTIIRPASNANQDSTETLRAFAALNPLRQAVAARLGVLSGKSVAAVQYIFSEADSAKGTGYAIMLRRLIAESLAVASSSMNTHTSPALSSPNTPKPFGLDHSSSMSGVAMASVGHRDFALFPSVYWLVSLHSVLTISISWLLSTQSLQPQLQQTAGRQQRLGDALYKLVEALRVDKVVTTGQFNIEVDDEADMDNALSNEIRGSSQKKPLVPMATEEGEDTPHTPQLNLADEGATAIIKSALAANDSSPFALYAPSTLQAVSTLISHRTTESSSASTIVSAYVSLPAVGLWIAQGVIIPTLAHGLDEICSIAISAFRHSYEDSAERAQYTALIAVATAPKKNIFKTSAGYMPLDTIVDIVIRSLQNVKVQRSSIFVDYSTSAKRIKAVEAADEAMTDNNNADDDNAAGVPSTHKKATSALTTNRNYLKESEEAASLEPQSERLTRNSLLRTSLSEIAQIHVFDNETPTPLDDNNLLIKWLHTMGRNVSVRRAAYGAQRREIRRINGLDAGGLAGSGGNIPLGAMIHRIQNGTYALQKARDAINNVAPRARIHQAAFGSLLRGFHRLAGSGASEAALRQAQALISRSLAHCPSQVRDRCEDMLCSYLSEAIIDADNRQLAIVAAHPPGSVPSDYTYQAMLAPSNQRSVLSLCLQCLYATVAQSASAKAANIGAGSTSMSDAAFSGKGSSIQLSTSDDAASSIDPKRPLDWILASVEAQEAEHQQILRQAAGGAKRGRGQSSIVTEGSTSGGILEVSMTSSQSVALFETDEMQKGNRYSMLATRLWSTMLNLRQGGPAAGGLGMLSPAALLRNQPQIIHSRSFFDFVDACPMITNYMWSFWHRHLCLSDVTRRVELGMEVLCYTAQTRPAYRGRALASLLYFSSLEKAKVARAEAILRLREFLTSPVTMAYCTTEERDAYIKLFADYCLLKCDRLSEIIKSVGSADVATAVGGGGGGNLASGVDHVSLSTPKASLRYHLLSEEKIKLLQSVMDFDYDSTSQPCNSVFDHYVDRLRLLQSWTTQGGAPPPAGVNPLSAAALEHAFVASNEEAASIIRTNFSLLCTLCQVDARQSVVLIKKLLEVYAVSATLTRAQQACLEVLTLPPALRAVAPNAQTQASNLPFALQRLYLGTSLCNAILQSTEVENVFRGLFGKVHHGGSNNTPNGSIIDVSTTRIDFSQQQLFASRLLPMVRQYPIGAGDLVCKLMSTTAIGVRSFLTELAQLPNPLSQEQRNHLSMILTMVNSHCKYLFTSKSTLGAMTPATIFSTNNSYTSTPTFSAHLFANALETSNTSNKPLIDAARNAATAFSGLAKAHPIIPFDIRMALPVLGFVDRVELRDVYIPAFVRMFAATEPLRMPAESAKGSFFRSLTGAEIIRIPEGGNEILSGANTPVAFLSVLQGSVASVELSLQEALWHMLAPCDIPTTSGNAVDPTGTQAAFLSTTTKRGIGPLDFFTTALIAIDRPRRSRIMIPNTAASTPEEVTSLYDQVLLSGSPSALQVGSRLAQMLMIRSVRPTFAPILSCGAATKQPILSLLSELLLLPSPSPAASEFAHLWLERRNNNPNQQSNLVVPISAFVPQGLLIGTLDNLKYRLRSCPDSAGAVEGRAIQYEQLLTEWLKALTTRLTSQVQDELQRGTERNLIQAGSLILVQQLIAHLVPHSLLPAATMAALAGPTVNKILTTIMGRETVIATAFPKLEALVKAVDVSAIVDRFQRMELKPIIEPLGNFVAPYWGKTPIEVLWILYEARHITAMENDPNYSEPLRIRGVRVVAETITDTSIANLMAPQPQQRPFVQIPPMEAQQVMAWALSYAEEHWVRLESHLLALPDRRLLELLSARPKLCAAFIAAHERNPQYQHMIAQLRESATL